MLRGFVASPIYILFSSEQGGMYLLQLMDNYVGGWALLMIGFAENIAIAFCYGRQAILTHFEYV